MQVTHCAKAKRCVMEKSLVSHTHRTRHVQFKQWSKTVYLITKRT